MTFHIEIKDTNHYCECAVCFKRIYKESLYILYIVKTKTSLLLILRFFLLLTFDCKYKKTFSIRGTY